MKTFKYILLLLTFCLLSNFANAQVPTPNAANGQQYCVGTTVVYGDAPQPTLGSTYSFNITGTSAQTFTNISSNTQIQVLWNTPGSYTITMTETSAAGCIITTQSNITVAPAIVATIDPITVCENGATQPITGLNLGINPVYSGTGVVANVFDPTGLAPGVYNISVTSTDANGCSITGTGTATVSPLPNATINSDQ